VKEVHLTINDNGSTIEIAVDTVVTISLEGNPSTGFAWAIDHNDQTILKNIQSKFDATSAASIGSNGKFTFRFQCQKKGNGKISLKYWRHWEGDASVTKRFEVRVKAI
jgi:inhibitor of cysteine peptidase